jgi:predicted permease
MNLSAIPAGIKKVQNAELKNRLKDFAEKSGELVLSPSLFSPFSPFSPFSFLSPSSLPHANLLLGMAIYLSAIPAGIKKLQNAELKNCLKDLAEKSGPLSSPFSLLSLSSLLLSSLSSPSLPHANLLLGMAI